ncbi:hypothetical protein MHYP_G00342320 [Metynnis hypsauchen]
MHNSSFFDRLKSQIPTIDSDVSSSSDNEEEISVYRRPSLFKLSQGAEVDLDYLSLGEPEIEDLLKSVTEPFTYGTGDDFHDQKDDVTPLVPKEDNDHKILVATGHDLEMDIINTTETESLPTESVDHSNSPDKKLDLVCEQKNSNSDMSTDEGECTDPHSEKFLQTSAGESCGKRSLKKMHTQLYPILSLKPLENWDLDQVLQSLKQHTGYRKDTREQGEPLLFQPFTYTDYSSEIPESNIMDQLAAFCEKQTSKKVDTKMINSTEEIHSKLRQPHISNLATRRRTDRWTVDYNDIAVELHQKNYNSPTVYIDLRNHDHQTKPADTCNSCSCPDLLKQGLFSERVGNTQPEAARRNGMLTGKSSLLQKIRESNQIRTENCVRRTTPEDSVEPQKEKILGIREDQHSCKISPLVKTSFPTTACEEAAAPLDKTLTSHKKEERYRDFA